MCFLIFGIIIRVIFLATPPTQTTPIILIFHYLPFTVLLFVINVSSVRFVKFQAVQTLMDLLSAKDQFTRYIR